MSNNINNQLEHAVHITSITEFDDFIYDEVPEDATREENPWVTFIGDEEGDIVFPAEVLGFASTQGTTHAHPPGQVLPKGKGRASRCAACRWSETAILWSDPTLVGAPGPASYVVIIRGCSALPGEEQPIVTMSWCVTAEEAVAALFVVPQSERGKDTPKRVLSHHSRDALAEAALKDQGLGSVWNQSMGSVV